jgi:hypothetical protein
MRNPPDNGEGLFHGSQPFSAAAGPLPAGMPAGGGLPDADVRLSSPAVVFSRPIPKRLISYGGPTMTRPGDPTIQSAYPI